MLRKASLIVLACIPVLPVVAAPSATTMQNYQETIKCAAVTVALQQHQQPYNGGAAPDARKLKMLAEHFHDAAVAAGKVAERPEPQVQSDIVERTAAYAMEFKAAKDRDQAAQVQTHLGRSLLGCALIGPS